MEQTKFHTKFTTIGALALVAGVLMTLSGPNEQSYFYGWIFWACVTFGFFGLSLLHHMAKGSWGYPVMRLLEAGGGWKMLFVFGLAFVPIMTQFKHALYPWTHADHRAIPVVAAKLPFLDGWFVPLSVLTFVLFIFWAYRNERWQRLEDETGDVKWRNMRTNWTSGFFPFFVLLINFAFTLWWMSMRPEWFSTISGIWFLVQQGLVAMAIIAIIIGTQAKKEPFNRVVNESLTKDIGNLMLTMTLLWAYFSFSQYLIIWSGNLPETISYWLERREGGYQHLGTLLIVIGFFVPFLMLLSPRMKRDPKNLATAGVVILIVRFLDIHYNVTPMFRDSVVPQLADVGAILAFGGVWCILFAQFVTKAPLLVKHQPQLKEATDHA